MRKIIVSLFTLVLVLSGCGGGSGSSDDGKPSTTCTVDIEDYKTTTQVFYTDGSDKIDKLVVTVTQKDAGKDISDAERKVGIKVVESEFEDYKGADLDVEFDGDDLVLSISLTVDELEEFPPVMGMDMDVDVIKEITHKEFTDNLESAGATCKENK